MVPPPLPGRNLSSFALVYWLLACGHLGFRLRGGDEGYTAIGCRFLLEAGRNPRQRASVVDVGMPLVGLQVDVDDVTQFAGPLQRNIGPCRGNEGVQATIDHERGCRGGAT